MHGQPGHAAQVCCSTLPDVVIVATKVLVRELRHKYKVRRKNVLVLQSGAQLWCFLFLTASPSLHFQLPLSMGFLLFNPIQNQCCSCSSDSLWAISSSPSAPPSSASRHVTSPGELSRPTQRLRGGPAEQSAPPRGYRCSAGWLRVSDRTGAPAAS